MPFNGSGVYNPVPPPDFPAVALTTVRAAQYNNQINDMAAALTTCVTRDGQSPATNNLPMATWRHTNVGAATARNQYARAAEVQDGVLTYLTSVAGADTITAVAPLSMAAYTAGQFFYFLPAANNTGAVTININSIAAENLRNPDGTELPANELVSGRGCLIFYNGTFFELVSRNISKLEAEIKAYIVKQSLTSGTTAGTSTAYTLDTAYNITAYEAGQAYWVTFHTASGNDPTITIDGVATPPTLVKQNSDGSYSNIKAGDFPTNHRSRVVMLSATEALVETLPPAGAATQIQTLEVPTFSAGAMTIPARTYQLDFQDASTGVVTNVRATAAAMVVPSGATLGLISGQQSDLILLALYPSANTIEYGIINVAGGVDLSETGTISTTALSTSADLANVAYSTTARASVPYRVLGRYRSTQTTAGTWAQAMTGLSGAGTLGLMTFASIGNGQTWQSVSRTAGTTYYNTTGKPIIYFLGGHTGGGTVNTQISINGGAAFTFLYGILVSGFGWSINGIIIPVGASYVVTGKPSSVVVEMELR